MPPFMLPAVFACYKTDGNLKKLKKDNAYLHRLIDANIELSSNPKRRARNFAGCGQGI